VAVSFEREFLIRLAPIWLACRWRVMGHWPQTDLAFDLLGMLDYQMEMKLLCEDVKRRLGAGEVYQIV